MNLGIFTRLAQSSKAQAALIGVMITGLTLCNVPAAVETKVISFVSAVVALLTALILGTSYEDGQQKSAGDGKPPEDAGGGAGSGAKVGLVLAALLLTGALGGCGATPKRQIFVTVDMATDVINGVSDAYVGGLITIDDLHALAPLIDSLSAYQQAAEIALKSGDSVQISSALANLHDATLTLLSAKVAAQQARQKKPAGGSRNDVRTGTGGGRLGRAGGAAGDPTLSGGQGQWRSHARRGDGDGEPREKRGGSIPRALVAAGRGVTGENGAGRGRG